MLTWFISRAFRELAGLRKYHLIGIAVLALGLTPVILIFLYVYYENSFDRRGEHSKRIYRVAYEFQTHFGRRSRSGIYPAPLAEAMVNQLPEVEFATRLRRQRGVRLAHEDKYFIEDNFFYADPALLIMFSFDLSRGTVTNALENPYSVLIAEDKIPKYFGNDDPMGRTISFNGIHELLVTGVYKPLPKNSHFIPDFLAPASLLSRPRELRDGSEDGAWARSMFFTYCQLRKDASIDQLATKFPKFLRTQSSNEWLNRQDHYFQPLSDIYLRSQLETELSGTGDIATLYLYFSIALMTLLITCISYINLATASFMQRGKEVGVRKTFGALRIHLIARFLTESFVLILFALILSIVAVAALLPAFRSFVMTEVSFGVFYELEFLLLLLGLTLAVTICAGVYPALVLSSLEPSSIFNNSFGSFRVSSFRKALMVIQLSFATLSVLGGFIVQNQLDYLKNKDLGYAKEEIIVLPVGDSSLRKSLAAVKKELSKHPNIVSVSSATNLPNRIVGRGPIEVSGPYGKYKTDFYKNYVDVEFVEHYEISIIEGRNFSRDFPSDHEGSLLVNMRAVEVLGLTSPLGQEITHLGRTGRIIGVFKDFHMHPLRQEVGPLLLDLSSEEDHFYLSVKIRNHQLKETVGFVEETVKSIYPDFNFEYRHLSRIIDAQYETESRLRQLLEVFGLVSMILAGLGLIGLMAVVIDQRTKEIAIRKVVGASAMKIAANLGREFSVLVLIANIVAWPVAWRAAEIWLNQFAYRMKLDWLLFLVAGMCVLTTCFAAISYQVLATARANPADKLRL